MTQSVMTTALFFCLLFFLIFVPPLGVESAKQSDLGSSELDPAVFIREKPRKPRTKRTTPKPPPATRHLPPPSPKAPPPSLKTPRSPRAPPPSRRDPSVVKSPVRQDPDPDLGNQKPKDLISGVIGPAGIQPAQPQDFEMKFELFEPLERNEQHDPFFRWYFTGAPKASITGHLMKDVAKPNGGDVEDYGVTTIEDTSMCKVHHDKLMDIVNSALQVAHDATSTYFRK